jgi:hypothetical protein
MFSIASASDGHYMFVLFFSAKSNEVEALEAKVVAEDHKEAKVIAEGHKETKVIAEGHKKGEAKVVAEGHMDVCHEEA